MELGTWYIQAICEIFMKNSWNTHIEDLLKMVDEKLSYLRSHDLTMQTATYTNEGFKICYLNPGLYIDHDGQVRKFDIFST